jgi:hypothetical protein
MIDLLTLTSSMKGRNEELLTASKDVSVVRRELNWMEKSTKGPRVPLVRQVLDLD